MARTLQKEKNFFENSTFSFLSPYLMGYYLANQFRQLKSSFRRRGIFKPIYTAKVKIYQVFPGYWFLVYPNSFKIPTTNIIFKHRQLKGFPKVAEKKSVQRIRTRGTKNSK